MTTKIDLDELERKANAASDGEWSTRSPPVTLALVARIRELERGYGQLVADCEERSECQDGTYYAEDRAILEKGAVLP